MSSDYKIQVLISELKHKHEFNDISANTNTKKSNSLGMTRHFTERFDHSQMFNSNTLSEFGKI